MRKASIQKHFNNRVSERLGIQTNKHSAKSYVKYLLQYTGNGLPAHAGRYWFYVAFLGSWAWVLFDKYTRRLITVLAETPRDYDTKEITRAMRWGTSKKRPWACVTKGRCDSIVESSSAST